MKVTKSRKAGVLTRREKEAIKEVRKQANRVKRTLDAILGEAERAQAAHQAALQASNDVLLSIIVRGQQRGLTS
jgi:hypothetical protein